MKKKKKKEYNCILSLSINLCAFSSRLNNKEIMNFHIYIYIYKYIVIFVKKKEKCKGVLQKYFIIRFLQCSKSTLPFARTYI